MWNIWICLNDCNDLYPLSIGFNWTAVLALGFNSSSIINRKESMVKLLNLP